MFKFLKDKLKGAISKITKNVEEDETLPIEEKEVVKEEPTEHISNAVEAEKPALFDDDFAAEPGEKEVEVPEPAVTPEPAQTTTEAETELEEFKPKEQLESMPAADQKIIDSETRAAEEPQKPAVEPAVEEKKGLFGAIKAKITTTKINADKFEELFSDLELSMLENNVAVEVIDKIKADLSRDLVDQPLKRGGIAEQIGASLKTSVESLFEGHFDLISKIKESEKPFVICFVGINGSGKTTTIAKFAARLKEQGLSCVLSASDTFRAASIEQLEHHAGKVGVKVIKHEYGSDPAAVAYDAIEHAKAQKLDVVLIDTAGRLHSNVNLVEEMKKIVRVAKPDLKIFIGESITGNDCIEQAQSFNDAVGVDGIILTKADVDEKGGAAISVSYVTKKPILYIGVGQEYADLKAFDPRMIVDGLGL